MRVRAEADGAAGAAPDGRGHRPAPHLRGPAREELDRIASHVSQARELIGKCDAVLRIGGPSNGADDMVATGQRLGKKIFHSLDEICERKR